MTIREKVIEAVKDLAEDASYEDAMERLRSLANEDRGMQQANDVQHIPVREEQAIDLTPHVIEQDAGWKATSNYMGRDWGHCDDSECKSKGRFVRPIELIQGDRRPKCRMCGSILRIENVRPTDAKAKGV